MAEKRTHNKKPLLSSVKEHTLKDSLLKVKEWILKHTKIVYPSLLGVGLLLVIIVALVARGDNTGTKGVKDVSTTVSENEASVSEDVFTEEAFIVNGYEDVNSLVGTYFQAMVDGNVEVVSDLHDDIIKDTTKIRIQELSKYIASYPIYEVYTKPGPVENSYMAYVYYKVLFEGHDIEVPGLQFFYLCTKESGELYIRNEAALDEHEIEYIRAIEEEEDVKELKNRITVENDEIYLDESNGMYAFMEQLTKEVDINVGRLLAEQEAQETVSSGNDVSTNETEVPSENIPSKIMYATTTATVNVRSSDSMTADKVDKLANGTRVQVLEKLANGWCRIQLKEKEVYIKTDYLSFEEDVSGVPSIGTVTANTKVNVRSQADQESARLGIAHEGDQYDLLEMVGDWCKIRYEGQVGYVKAEFVTKNQ